MAGPFSLPAISFLSNFAGILLDKVIVLRSKGATCECGPLFCFNSREKASLLIIQKYAIFQVETFAGIKNRCIFAV